MAQVLLPLIERGACVQSLEARHQLRLISLQSCHGQGCIGVSRRHLRLLTKTKRSWLTNNGCRFSHLPDLAWRSVHDGAMLYHVALILCKLLICLLQSSDFLQIVLTLLLELILQEQFGTSAQSSICLVVAILKLS
jgi:hypothetical protein